MPYHTKHFANRLAIIYWVIVGRMVRLESFGALFSPGKIDILIFKSGDRSFISQHGLPGSWRPYLACCRVQHNLNILFYWEHCHRSASRLDTQEIFGNWAQGP